MDDLIRANFKEIIELRDIKNCKSKCGRNV